LHSFGQVSLPEILPKTACQRREGIYECHDLQILATAAVGGMNTLLTANEKDFPRIASIAIAPLSKLEW
jgi:predicted nucleic acid-binding protein